MKRRNSYLWTWVMGCSACAGGAAGGSSGGTVVVEIDGGVEAREGIGAAAFADGFAVDFDGFYVNFGDFSLQDGTSADVRTAPGTRLVNVVGPQAVEAWRLDDVSARRWDGLTFSTLPVAEDTTAVDVDAQIQARMQSEGASALIVGSMQSPEGESCAFELSIPTTIRYDDCVSGDGNPGVFVRQASITSVEVTWHLTHLFFDSLAENAALRAAPFFAMCPEDRPLTLTDLEGQSLAAPRDASGALLRDANNNPVVYIAGGTDAETLSDFVLEARFGHLNGLDGFCTTTSIP